MAHRQQYGVTLKKYIRLTGGYQVAAAFVVVFGFDHFEGHADELAVFVLKAFRHMKVDDRYTFVDSVFFFPGRGFHFIEATAYDDFDIGAA